MHRFLIALYVCGLAVAGCQKAETLNEPLNRGLALDNKGDHDAAIAQFTHVIAAANPTIPIEKSYMSDAYDDRGIAWEREGEIDKAIADFTKAIEVNPRSFFPYDHRSNAWLAKGEYDKSIADCTKAMGLYPEDTTVCTRRGGAWQAKGEYVKAVADYTKAVALAPKDAGATNNLAVFYSICADAKYRDGKKAVELAKKADQLSGGKNYAVLSTLAAAYAESGDFVKARELQQKGIELSRRNPSRNCVPGWNSTSKANPITSRPRRSSSTFAVSAATGPRGREFDRKISGQKNGGK
jgi:tetratricopeptide (TPR) repeat protein